MQIPEGWNYLTTSKTTVAPPSRAISNTNVLTHTTTAFFHAPEFTLQVTHKTRDFTLVQVREPGFEGYDFQDRHTQIEWGAHRNPDAAFRFCEAYLADGGDDFRPTKGRKLSARYVRSIDAAYATRATA